MVFLIDTPFGQAGIAWTKGDPASMIIRIYLPGELPDAPSPDVSPSGPEARIERLALQIRRFLSGENVDFSLEEFALRGMSLFQQKVLSMCRQIPRGKVCTYGGLAGRLLIPKAARAVGTALARNPFPLVIPCHRVVRMDGNPGNFGGGRSMKKDLLLIEGIHFDVRGRVSGECFW